MLLEEVGPERHRDTALDELPVVVLPRPARHRPAAPHEGHRGEHQDAATVRRSDGGAQDVTAAMLVGQHGFDLDNGSRRRLRSMVCRTSLPEPPGDLETHRQLRAVDDLPAGSLRRLVVLWREIVVRKIIGWVLLALGTFLVAIGLMAALWAPGQVKRTPLDTDSATRLAGTADKLNPATGEVENTRRARPPASPRPTPSSPTTTSWSSSTPPAW